MLEFELLLLLKGALYTNVSRFFVLGVWGVFWLKIQRGTLRGI